MIDLHIFLKNPFPHIDASQENIKKFYSDHSARLANQVNLGAPLTVLVAPTQKAVADLLKSEVAYDTSGTQLKSRTKSVDQIIEQFVKSILGFEPAVIGKFNGIDTPGYIEFYPHRRNTYHNVNKGNFESLIGQVITALKNHPDLFGDEPVNDFQTLLDEYTEAREKQLQQKDNVSGSGLTWDQAVNAMATQAFATLIAIINLYHDDPDRIDLFYDQSIVARKHHPKPLPPDQAADDQTTGFE